jgi:hypothetical protein
MKTSGLLINEVTSYSARSHASIDVIMEILGLEVHKISYLEEAHGCGMVKYQS